MIKPEIFYKGWQGQSANNDIDKIVKEYTSRKVVVQLEAHDFTGKYPLPGSNPSLNDLINWHVKYAQKYKSNPYVWFNIMNEPGSGRLDSNWKTVNEAVVKAIRGTGARNIIVCDGHGFASELWNSGDGLVTEKDSAILAYGQYLTKAYANLVFSVHMYSWTGKTSKFDDFVKKVQGKSLAIMVGEFGTQMQKNGLDDTFQSVRTTLKVCKNRKVGWLQWAWDGGDGFSLTDETTTQGGGIAEA